MHENPYVTLEHTLTSFMSCFPHKKYEVWETFLRREWDIFCVVEHKCHELVGSTIHSCGYSTIYAKRLNNHYLGTRLILWDSIMDDLKLTTWILLVVEVLKLDICTWLHGNDLGFTFQFV